MVVMLYLGTLRLKLAGRPVLLKPISGCVSVPAGSNNRQILLYNQRRHFMPHAHSISIQYQSHV